LAAEDESLASSKKNPASVGSKDTHCFISSSTVLTGMLPYPVLMYPIASPLMELWG
jgi:hypothetical protein